MLIKLMLMLIKSINNIIRPLEYMFNVCFERAEFHDKMKTSKVIIKYRKQLYI